MLIENISGVYGRIEAAAYKAGRKTDDIRLIAVSKTVGLHIVRMGIEAGLLDLGESKVQEAREKIGAIRSFMPHKNITWHMIGHLQRNKTKAAVGLFDIIHSVDSEALLSEIDKEAKKSVKIQRVLIEVKLSDEKAKHGISKDALGGLLDYAAKLKNVSIIGLMTVPPYFEDPEGSRPYFRELRLIRDKMEEAGYKLPQLSMGMTGDFEVAIEEGATMVRVGTAIFGERV